jgi:hypothetical protein
MNCALDGLVVRCENRFFCAYCDGYLGKYDDFLAVNAAATTHYPVCPRHNEYQIMCLNGSDPQHLHPVLRYNINGFYPMTRTWWRMWGTVVL